jgi:hypothetical protein
MGNDAIKFYDTISIQISILIQALVTHPCIPSYLGG